MPWITMNFVSKFRVQMLQLSQTNLIRKFVQGNVVIITIFSLKRLKLNVYKKKRLHITLDFYFFFYY